MSTLMQALNVAENRFSKIVLYLPQRYAIGMKPREEWYKAMKSLRLVGLNDCSKFIRIHGTIVALCDFRINES